MTVSDASERGYDAGQAEAWAAEGLSRFVTRAAARCPISMDGFPDHYAAWCEGFDRAVAENL